MVTRFSPRFRPGRPGWKLLPLELRKGGFPASLRPVFGDPGRFRGVSRLPASAKSGASRTPFGIIYSQIPNEVVEYLGKHAPGTIIVKTSERRLYYVLDHGKAIRYGIAVGMEGYSWSGVSTVSAKREWPDWTPTPNILARFPNLPHHMDGGPDNPLGARALYLGASLYRIHGTNEPWKLGGDVSSGCIRMSNDDVIDLYNRTKIGATVIVQR
jgi:lipoprotein-anchoring transpeptidase ErfK/SrfK